MTVKFIHLPEVTGPCDLWTIEPVWIRDGGALHAVAWISSSEDNRFFLSAKHDAAQRFFRNESGTRSVVACGNSDVIGIVMDPASVDYPMCSMCCKTILYASMRKRIVLWSSQLAEQNIAKLQSELGRKGDHIGAWAISQFDPTDPKLCLKMSKEIEKRSPNIGTAIIQANGGINLGCPKVSLRATDKIKGWILAEVAQYEKTVAKRTQARVKSKPTRTPSEDTRQLMLAGD